MELKVTKSNVGRLALTAFSIAVGLFLVDIVISLFVIDNWWVAPGLVGWLIWGLVAADGLVMWYLFRRKALNRLRLASAAEDLPDRVPALLLRDLILSWAGFLIVGVAGYVGEFAGAGVLLVLAPIIASVCLIVSYLDVRMVRELEVA